MHVTFYITNAVIRKTKSLEKNNSPKIRFDFASFFPRDTRLINDSLSVAAI